MMTIVETLERDRNNLLRENERLRAAIRDIAEMADDEWSEVKYHAMRDWARKTLADEQSAPCTCNAARASVGDICPRCGGVVKADKP